MGRRKKQLTQAQSDWRNSILRGKISSIKNAEEVVAVVTKDDKIRKCFFFLNNCVYWINEYIEGRENKERLLKTSKAIQENARKLELLLIENPELS